MTTFIMPAEGRITSHFGMRLHPIDKVYRGHSGVDIAKSGNVPVVAAADGTVTRVGSLGTYGNVIMIVHNINGQTYETNYAHLHSMIVDVGQKVKQGQRIGRMGNTGNSTGQHLHFEIHKGRYAPGQPNAVDPLTLIGKDLAPAPANSGTYRVKKGDTLTAIAKKYNTTVDTLVQLNDIKDANLIHISQKIKLPDTSRDKEFHTVKQGDTVWALANKHGSSVKEIADWNNLKDPGLIRPGQKLRIK